MTFSFEWSTSEITAEDCVRLASHFSRTVMDFLSCERVSLVPVAEGVEQEEPVPAAWANGIAMVKERQRPAVESENARLYLPLWRGQELFAIAVLDGAEPALFDQGSNWLLDRSRFISRELRLIKQWSLDPVTGLFNGRHLCEELRLQLAEMEKNKAAASGVAEALPDFALVLVEIFPRSREAGPALEYIARAGAHLGSVVGPSSPLHHLGAGIFGLIWPRANLEQALKMGDALLRWLKREKFSRVHLGITALTSEASRSNRAEVILDQAWQALKAARERGPYALCTYEMLAAATVHPLRLPAAPVMAALQKIWHGSALFSLVLLQQDQEPVGPAFSKRVRALIGRDLPLLPLDRREAFIVLDGVDGAGALAWVEDFKKRLKALAGITYSVGIASYPCHNFRKSEMAINARKALLHTGFFGPDTATLFDGVSLNISGDVFYNEGDLSRAAQEYRQGLALDPANLNLLNSLGVAYAQMGRYRQAIPFFEQALALDPADFMALFNLGFAYLTQGRHAAVIDCFERALAIDDQHFDLVVQLGRLYCQAGRYEDVIKLLARKREVTSGGRRDVSHGAFYRYLGEACKALGRNREAMVNLQRAVQHNPRDAGAMSLLGELYGSQKQGTDIALSMCRQAVEIDESSSLCWGRLGLVQHLAGNHREAVSSLKKSLQLDGKNSAAAFSLGRVYEDEGRLYQAARQYEKILRQEPERTEAALALAAVKKRSGK